MVLNGCWSLRLVGLWSWLARVVSHCVRCVLFGVPLGIGGYGIVVWCQRVVLWSCWSLLFLGVVVRCQRVVL
jgi:hypothetical protein